MLCALDGQNPWARFTSSDPSLMTWKMAERSFTQGKDAGGAAGERFPVGFSLASASQGCSFWGLATLRNPVSGHAGALFHKIPGAPAGGPTHMINGPGTGAGFYLGNYDSKKEIMTITSPLQGEHARTISAVWSWFLKQEKGLLAATNTQLYEHAQSPSQGSTDLRRPETMVPTRTQTLARPEHNLRPALCVAHS